MTGLTRKFAVAAAALALGVTGLELGEALSVPGVHSAVSSAEAIVGRPLTPVSVAGVARRCAAGVTC
jgi:hypothetical protein